MTNGSSRKFLQVDLTLGTIQEEILDQSMLLSELLIQLAIPVSEVDLVAVNGEQTNLPETWIAPGDKVELYPPMGGG